mgnify:FL=1
MEIRLEKDCEETNESDGRVVAHPEGRLRKTFERKRGEMLSSGLPNPKRNWWWVEVRVARMETPKRTSLVGIRIKQKKIRLE